MEMEVGAATGAGFGEKSFLEPRRMAEKALTAVIQEAYVQGISTRLAHALQEIALVVAGGGPPLVAWQS
jgi:transposase-like protein